MKLLPTPARTQMTFGVSTKRRFQMTVALSTVQIEGREYTLRNTDGEQIDVLHNGTMIGFAYHHEDGWFSIPLKGNSRNFGSRRDEAVLDIIRKGGV